MKNPHAVALGSIKTVKKRKSSRLNGLKGGRPKLPRARGLKKGKKAWLKVDASPMYGKPFYVPNDNDGKLTAFKFAHDNHCSPRLTEVSRPKGLKVKYMEKELYEKILNTIESHNDSLKMLFNLVKMLDSRIDLVQPKEIKKWYQFWV